MRAGVDGTTADRVVQPAARLRGQPALPGDKSISHRSLLFSALSPGSQAIVGLSQGGDVACTAGVLRALGIPVSIDGTSATVGEGALSEPVDVLDCGNSGTSMRLLSGLLAGQPFLSVLTGDGSLRSRPMKRVVEPLMRMGARIDGRDGGNRAPLILRGGGLVGIEHVSPIASAQVKSCLMLAGLYASGELTVIEPHRSRDHTERMLAAGGVDLEILDDGVRMACGQRPNFGSTTLEVPTDISAAAFFAVAAAIVPDAHLTMPGLGTNPTRTGLFDALDSAGVSWSLSGERVVAGEPRADFTVRGSDVRAFEVSGALVPRLIDEIPVLAILASRARGTTVFRDAADLRVKESDRVATTVAMLRAFGVEVDERPDGLSVTGTGGAPLRGGGVVDAHGDHRIAMAAAVGALVADGPTTLRGVQAVDTSFPGFFEVLEDLSR
jgi:3-phosphoshikimate 1-carboxyvinyltransferase